jgi:hypothetical protein
MNHAEIKSPIGTAKFSPKEKNIKTQGNTLG